MPTLKLSSTQKGFEGTDTVRLQGHSCSLSQLHPPMHRLTCSCSPDRQAATQAGSPLRTAVRYLCNIAKIPLAEPNRTWCKSVASLADLNILCDLGPSNFDVPISDAFENSADEQKQVSTGWWPPSLTTYFRKLNYKLCRGKAKNEEEETATACWVAPETLLAALTRLWVKELCLEGSPLLSRDQWVRSVGCAVLAKLSSEENNNGLSITFLPVPNYSTKAKCTVPASLSFSRYPSGQTPA